eukprot:953430-Pleurochrysis_carterae.AAC.2
MVSSGTAHTSIRAVHHGSSFRCSLLKILQLSSTGCTLGERDGQRVVNVFKPLGQADANTHHKWQPSCGSGAACASMVPASLRVGQQPASEFTSCSRPSLAEFAYDKRVKSGEECAAGGGGSRWREGSCWPSWRRHRRDGRSSLAVHAVQLVPLFGAAAVVPGYKAATHTFAPITREASSMSVPFVFAPSHLRCTMEAMGPRPRARAWSTQCDSVRLRDSWIRIVTSSQCEAQGRAPANLCA